MQPGFSPSHTASHQAAGAPTGAVEAGRPNTQSFPTQNPEVLRKEFARPRLFMQLQVFTGVQSLDAAKQVLAASNLEAVLYQDFLDPRGIGVLLMSEDPGVFAGQARALFASAPFAPLLHRPQLTMTGCTYSTGRDANPDDWMLQRPRRNSRNPAWDWAVWYPLRRKSEFALLPKEEQGKMLFEHAMMAKPYGDIDSAADVRLSCHGIDTNDNEFVLGLIGPSLYPLSHLVQEMRKSQQTSRYIQSLGPFFIGHVAWRRPL
jgi:chlorite dismutase